MYGDGREDRDDPAGLRTFRAGCEDHARRHPLRLAILAMLASGGPRNVAEISGELPGAPSLSVLRYHLGVLHQAELVTEKAEGTRRIFAIV